MAGKQLFANNAKGKLNAGVIAGDTQLTLQAGQGALFPAPAGTDWFKFTLIKGDGSIEVCKCTSRAGDVLNPILRAQEGTVAIAFNAGDKVELRWTRDSANQFIQRTDSQTNIARYAGAVGGTSDALTATIASDLNALVDGLRVDAEALSANGTTTPTFNLTLGATATGAKTMKKFAASALAGADIAGVGHRIKLEYRAADDSWLLLNPAGTLSRSITSVRQAIQSAKIDANGYNAAFAAGTGLAVDLSAAAVPFNASFANGFDSLGPFELSAQLTADAASAVASLAASNTSFLHGTWSSISAITWSKCLIPPQYGLVFDRTKQCLLNLEAANGSTTFTDDFGNQFTPGGNAQITTAQFKFGTSSMVLDGVGDFISSTAITSLGVDSWEISLWFRINALPGAGTAAMLVYAGNGGGLGALLYLNNVAGTTKLGINLSSTGTTNDIGSPAGTNTVWTLNQWNKVRFVFDALAGTYRVYLSLNGAGETQDITISSSLRICALTMLRFGTDQAGAQGFNGWMDAIRFITCATNTSAETPSASAPTIADHPVHFYSVPKMQMFEVTAASVAPNVDPTLTQRNRLFVGEADTGGGAVSALRNYPIRARYRSQPTGLNAAGATVNFASNMGTKFGIATRMRVVNTDSSGSQKGTEREWLTSRLSGTQELFALPLLIKDRNNLICVGDVGGGGGFSGIDSVSQINTAFAGSTGYFTYVEAERTW